MSTTWTELNRRAAPLGLQFGTFLLPNEGVDPNLWAVIACDQHTSNPTYWQEVEKIVGSAPSTLRLVLPEVYLGSGKEAERLSDISKTMQRYGREGLLSKTGPALIALERKTAHVASRRGLLVVLDLEQYDYHPETDLPVRATEETLEHRLPPRMAIRRDAVVEVSHVLVLIDDPKQLVIQPLFQAISDRKPSYRSSLMLNGGELSGYVVDDPEIAAGVVAALEELSRGARSRYAGRQPPLFAVGDGNHTLASAKKVWDEKKAALGPDHPLRYAMVELVNSHDPMLNMQPIHRVIWGVEPAALIDGFVQEADVQWLPDEALASSAQDDALFLQGPETAGRFISSDMSGSAAGIKLQRHLETLEAAGSDVRIDYVHGRQEALRIAERTGGTAIIYPRVDPSIVFETAANHRVLPRKFFSLGEAEEKRYYFECRSL